MRIAKPAYIRLTARRYRGPARSPRRPTNSEDPADSRERLSHAHLTNPSPYQPLGRPLMTKRTSCGLAAGAATVGMETSPSRHGRPQRRLTARPRVSPAERSKYREDHSSRRSHGTGGREGRVAWAGRACAGAQRSAQEDRGLLERPGLGGAESRRRDPPPKFGAAAPRGLLRHADSRASRARDGAPASRKRRPCIW